MAEYIISGLSGGKYVRFDGGQRISATTDRNKATRFADANKAWRVIMNQISKKKRSDWFVEMYSIDIPQPQPSAAQVSPEQKGGFRADLDVSSMDRPPFDWERIAANLKTAFTDILKYKEDLAVELNQVNNELCDCEHACEFFKCNAAQGYKLYSMIHERRIKRRFLKDELRRAEAILGMSREEIVSGKIEAAFAEIANQTYAPRVLKELFDL